MSQGHSVKVVNERRLLVERVASSRYVNRSARLRDLLVYLSDRVLDDQADEIHEQEVGHKVFGRPADYDTGSDNIVRVHASMLRKRLEQYFAAEGATETLILEIPKGNYAPVFRERDEAVLPSVAILPDVEPQPPGTDRRLWLLASLACLFACSTAYLLVRRSSPAGAAADRTRPAVRLFWSQIFRSDRPTDIVLDDAALGLYQELTGRTLTLNDYFDRSYLRAIADSDSALVLRRQSSYASTSFLWKLFQMPGGEQRHTVLRFARDYTFRDLKADNAVLLGTSRSNLWQTPFDPKLGLRWMYDKSNGIYYPVDLWNGNQSYQNSAPGEGREGYFSIALVPNLGGTGNVLILGGTGGSAINAGADFLADEPSVSALLQRLPPAKDKSFPHFEALIKVKGRSALPKDATVVIARPPRP
jgi:hypothetical protein